MPNPDNEPQIPKNQSAINDERTGMVARDWYRFFLNLLNKVNEGGGGAGTGTVTSINVSGGSTGLTTSGGPITTAGTISLAGTLDVNNGGTGAITAAAALTNLGAYPASNPNGYTSNTGTVTSVGISAPGIFSVSGSPVTSTGTLALTYSGTALPIANGGTGATTANDARTNLGAAASGANSDITSLSGITGGISTPDFIQFDTTATVTDATGKLYYALDDQYQTLAFQMNGAVIQHVGETQFYRIKCSGAITKGQVVMFAGTVGASGGLIGAAATGLSPIQADYILGLAGETGANNDWITVCAFGEVKSINTTGGAESWAQGDELYYNPLVTGGLTKVKPTTPAAICKVAAVVYVGSSNGILFVRPTYGSVLGGTDGNVNFTSLASGNTLIYDANQSVWVNANLTASTGINVTNGNGSITLTNTAPDQVVSLTGAGTTSISGTYPNFTITSNDQYAGTVTSVSGNGTVNGISLTGTVTSSGNLTLGGTLSGVNLTSQVTGTLPIANGGTGQTTAVAAFDALSPATTKGDLIVSDGTDNVRQAVGTNNFVLTADSTTATGVKWAAAAGGLTISNDTTTATNLYPTFAGATSGTMTTIYTGNANLLYKPSTGELTSQHLVASNGIFVNSQTIANNYTIAAGSSGTSSGPMTVNNNITVTVATGARWVVL